MEPWKSLGIFDCWGPEDALGFSYLPCCHELLGSSRVCWHWAASNLQDFSILMGIMHLQNTQGSLWGLGHQDKFTVMAETRAICTKARQGVQRGYGGFLLGWKSKPMKIGDKIHTSSEPELLLSILQRWATQNTSFIDVLISWFPCLHVDSGMRTKLPGIINPAALQGHLCGFWRALHRVCCRYNEHLWMRQSQVF